MDMKEDVKIYEIGFLAKEENDREEIVKILTNYGAKIVDAGKMSRIKLAYPIKKENFAYFGYLFFSVDLPAEKSLASRKGDDSIVKKAGNDLKTSQKILRFLIVAVYPEKLDKKSEKEPLQKVLPDAVVAKPASENFLLGEQRTITELSNEALEKKLEEILK